MILRSITRHVREQNWFAVGLDFLIVVLGILLAFQITEWSAERQQRIAEARYLSELARDLQADVDELRGGWQQAWRRPSMERSIGRSFPRTCSLP